MPTGRVMVVLTIISAVLYIGDQVIHLAPVKKTNHAICRAVTFGQKCKPAKETK